MTAALGQVSLIAVGGPTSVQTAGINTTASGSNFYVAVVVIGANGATVPVITDNMGNNAKWATSQIGAQFTNTNTEYIWRFQIANGVGGVNHAVTATFGGSVANIEVMLMEMTGCALVPLDQSNTGTNGASTGPATSGSITVAPPATSEILVSVMMGHSSGSNLIFAEANGFIIQASQESFAVASAQWAVATKIVSASNPYSASWSWGGANIFVASCIDSFLGGPSQGVLQPFTRSQWFVTDTYVQF